MEEHPTYTAIVLACMDGAYRKPDGGLKGMAGELLESRFSGKTLDHIGAAGASVDLVSRELDETNKLFGDIALSYYTHRTRLLLIFEHEACGRYAELAKEYPEFASPNDKDLHDYHSGVAAQRLKKTLPELHIERFYVTRNLTVESFGKTA